MDSALSFVANLLEELLQFGHALFYGIDIAGQASGPNS